MFRLQGQVGIRAMQGAEIRTGSMRCRDHAGAAGEESARDEAQHWKAAAEGLLGAIPRSTATMSRSAFGASIAVCPGVVPRDRERGAGRADQGPGRIQIGCAKGRAAWHREWDRERLDIPGRYILLPRSADIPLHRREAGVEGHRAGPDKRLPIRPVSLTTPPTAHAMVQPDAAIPLLVVPVLEACPPSRRRARRARRRARRRALLGSSSVE